MARSQYAYRKSERLYWCQCNLELGPSAFRKEMAAVLKPLSLVRYIWGRCLSYLVENARADCVSNVKERC